MPDLAIFKVDTLVDHGHFAHTIHPTIIFQTIGESNRDQRTAGVCCDLDNLASVTLAVILLTLKIVSNLNRSELAHLQLSCGDTLILHFISALSTKKNRKNLRKIFFVWHDICCCHIGRAFGTRFAVACHFGRNRPLSAILAGCLVCRFGSR